MVEFKRILCPVDLTELSPRPLAYAGAFARWYNAHLTALHVVVTFEPVHVPASVMFEPMQTIYPVTRPEILEQLQIAATAANVPPERMALAAEAGDAASTIVDQAKITQADLIVMGTHGRSGFDRLLLGSVAEKVLLKAPCPVLTVPPHAPASPPAGIALHSILCPIDFSPAALDALKHAIDLARRADASLTLIHAIELLAEEEPRSYAHFNVPEFREYLLKEAHERLMALVPKESGVTRGIKHVVVAGRAHRKILEIADDQAVDLIVMGAQGRGGAALALFGSTTQQVVRGAACAVMTVR